MPKKAQPKRGKDKTKSKDSRANLAQFAAVQARIVQTSPITIGGGSVSIDFDHGYYTPAGGRFTHPTDQLESVWVYRSGSRLKWDLLRFVFGKDCLVTIHTKLVQAVSDIVIRSRPGGPLSIEFDIGEFPLEAAGNRVHSNDRRNLVDAIEVVDRSDNSKATFSIPTGGFIQIVNLARP